MIISRIDNGFWWMIIIVTKNSHYFMMINDDWRLMVTIQRAEEIHGPSPSGRSLSRAFSEMNSMLNPFNWPVKIRFLQALWKTRMDSLWQTCHEVPWAIPNFHLRFMNLIYYDILVYPYLGCNSMAVSKLSVELHAACRGSTRPACLPALGFDMIW